MRRRSLGFSLAAAAVMLPVAAAGSIAAEVVVRVEGVTPSPSRVYVSLCMSGLQPENCGISQVALADAQIVTFRFADVPPGSYAVAAFQDLNGNGTLDRSPRGLPREPYGLSREAGRTAAPRFDRASISVHDHVEIVVRLAAPGRP